MLAANWLERLSLAHDYQELQEILTAIEADVREGGDNSALAQSINEAVLRLEEERARDETGLHEIQAHYEAFQGEHRGVTGWFKRHMPFSGTRCEELAHRDQVADQTAEILADNLVIARTQLLKERYLTSAQRRLGRRPAEWQLELDRCVPGPHLESLAAVLTEMAAEINRSHAFLTDVVKDIDAFAAAPFSEKTDRQRRDADLATARQEIVSLRQEVDAERVLKRDGLKLLGGWVAVELSAADASFLQDGEHCRHLQSSLDRLDQARASLATLATASAAVGELVKELRDAPSKVRELRKAAERAEDQRSESALAAAHKTAALEERRVDRDRAKHDMEQKQRALQWANEAFKTERKADKSMPMSVEAGPPDDSLLVSRCREAKSAIDAAEAVLRSVTSSYEEAERDADKAQNALDSLGRQIHEQRDSLAALEARVPQLQRELAVAIDRGQTEFAEAGVLLVGYLTHERGTSTMPLFPTDELQVGIHGWLGAYGLERLLAEALFQAEQEYQRHLQAAVVLDRITKWLSARRQVIETERTQAHNRRLSAWRARCQELLGEELTSEAVASPPF